MTASAADFPSGAILIPAHNEAAVIDRTLRRLAPLAAHDNVEICVICNGCTDETAQRARQHPGVHVIDIAEASKAAALNAGDTWATRWPRLYLDADIEIDPDAIAHVFRALEGSVSAARPPYRYDTTGASAVVRAYYRARRRMPSTRSALWGAGAYALSKAGHDRFAAFPAVIADDLFVDGLFLADEKSIVAASPVRVRTPRTTAALMGILRRNSRGAAELDAGSVHSSVRELVAGVRGLSSAVDAVVYAALAAAARLRLTRPGRRGPTLLWERDTSSRQALP